MTKNSTQVIRKANLYLIYQCISNHGPITTEAIVQKTGISRPTVVSQLKKMIEDDLVSFCGFSESTGGRSPSLYTINRNARYAIGVDLEFPIVRAAISTNGGEIIAFKEKEYENDEEGTVVLDELQNMISSLMEAVEDKSRIIGIGVGLSGTIDIKSGVSVRMERIRGWHNVPIVDILSSRFSLPVYIKNDVHLLGLAEEKLYLTSEVTDYIYIGIRGGVGSFIVKNGKAMDGEHGNSGFIGHTSLNPDGERCICGSRGCLDIYAGELSMANKYRNLGGQYQGHLDLSTFISLAQKGDELAMDLVKQAARYLGIAIANMVKTLEICTVIVGSVSGDIEGSFFIDDVRASAHKYLNDYQVSQLEIRCGKLQAGEAPLGGCFLVFSKMLKEPKLSLSI